MTPGHGIIHQTIFSSKFHTTDKQTLIPALLHNNINYKNQQTPTKPFSALTRMMLAKLVEEGLFVTKKARRVPGMPNGQSDPAGRCRRCPFFLNRIEQIII